MARMPLRDGDPSRIGRYRLTARLGAGGMGVVYLGTARDGSQVAIKVPRPELADDQEFRARFRREVAVLARVQGLCTVRVIEADTESAKPFLVTEYAAGPSLSEHITAPGPLPPQMLYGLATGLAEALAAIHSAGVVHRDLKPGNVLLTPTGPKVIDFGIAQTLDATALTQTGMTVGSAGFMAPEQVTGRAGPPADIFSWALTVAYAASGQPPFGSGPANAIMYRILHDYPDIGAVPRELRPAIEAALARHPADRPTARDLLGWLTQQTDASGDQPTQHVLSRTWPRPAPGQATAVERPRRARRLPVLTGGLTLAVVAGVAAAYVASSPGHHNPGSSAAASSPARTSIPGPSSSSTRPAGGLPIVTFGTYIGAQPSVIDVTGGSANQVENIDWVSWTATGAHGEGVACVPSCAVGKIIPVPVVLTLSHPVDGQFTRMSETRDGVTATMTYAGTNWPFNASPVASSCPTPGQVMAVWKTASPSDRQSWGTAGAAKGFGKVQCWRDWVVAGYGTSAVVFSQSGTLHLIPDQEVKGFDILVCGNPDAPSAWKSASTGVATC